MQRMQMKMRLPLKHGTGCAQHFAEAYSEPYQASEMELFAKTVNDLKHRKLLSQKEQPWVFERALRTPLVSLSYTYERG